MSYVTLAFAESTGVLGRSTVVGGLLLDVATAEELTLENDVTDHPVEEGSDMSDHVRERPRTLTITGLIGDTSLGVLPSLSQLAAQAVSAIQGQDTATNPFGSSMSRSDVASARSALQSAKRLPTAGKGRLVQAMATLCAAADAKLSVAVVTGISYYPEYWITSVRFSRSNAESGGFLSVTVTLRTIRKVATETGTLQYPKAPADAPKASETKKNKGKANQKTLPTTGSAVKDKVDAYLYLE